MKMDLDRRKKIITPILTESKDSPKIYKLSKTEDLSLKQAEDETEEKEKAEPKRLVSPTQPIVTHNDRPISI